MSESPNGVRSQGSSASEKDETLARPGIGGRSAYPNPNRNAVMHCPYCDGEDLQPDMGIDYA